MSLITQGLLSYYAKDYDASVVHFRRVISEYPKNKHYWLAKSCLVSALKSAGRFDEAVEALGGNLDTERRAELSASEMASEMLQIADIYYEAKKYREATKAFKEVRDLKDAPGEMKAEAAYRSGLCYRNIGYDRSSRMCMDEVVKRYPDSQWAKKAKGMLYVWSQFGAHTAQ